MADVEKKHNDETANQTLDEKKATDETSQTATTAKETTDENNKTDVSKSPECDKKTKVSAEKSVTTETSDVPVEKTESSPSALEARIIQQIEYYFGDANLSRDKFLLNEITKNDGWVPFTVLLTFKRLASMTTDPKVIVAAIKKSDECLVEINATETELRRHPDRPLAEQNEASRMELFSRTAYVKGFPLTMVMSDIIDFFMPFEKVTNVVMRKYVDKPTKTYKFKGSVFVSFAKKEQCDEFLKKDKVCFGETELVRKWQCDYYESKKLEKQNEKAKNERLRNSKGEKDNFKIELPKGAVIHLDGIAENITREQIKEVIIELGGEVAFIDYNKGDKSGHVRLSSENSAKPIVDKLTDLKLKIGSDCEATARVIDGDEETEFLATVVMNMKSRRNQSQQNRHHHHKGGRGGHHQNRKRPNSQTTKINGEPPMKQKQQATVAE